MRWEDVHDDRIHIPHPKMGKPFDVPLTTQLRDVLVDLREHGTVMYPRSPYVCPSASRLGYVQNPFDKHLAGYSPHMCRRSYAGAAAHVLKNPYLVKALLNHAVSDVTELMWWSISRRSARRLGCRGLLGGDHLLQGLVTSAS